MKGPRQSISGAYIGDGPNIITPHGWTPDKLNTAGSAYWLRPSLASTGADPSITLVSGKLSAANVGNSKSLIQGTAAQRLTYNSGSPLHGYSSYDALASDTASLMSTTGGVTGAASHSIWTIQSHVTSGSYNGIITFGTSSQSSTIGAVGDQHWAGGNGVTAPYIGPGDNLTHLFVTVYNGTTKSLYIDGEFLPGGVNPSTFAYNLTADFGIGPAFSTVPTCSIYSAGWLKRTMTTLEMRTLEQWASRNILGVGNRYLACFGDSQTQGFSLTVAPNNWPNRLSALSLLTRPYDIASTKSGVSFSLVEAVAGYTTANVISDYTPFVQRYNNVRPKCVATVWVGTNDLYAGVGGDFSAASAWTGIQTICSALRAQGWYVILINCLPRTQANTPVSYATQQPILNGLIAASGTTVGNVLVDAAAMFPNSDDLTYYQADKVHLNRSANDIFAGTIAGILNRL